MDQRVNSWVLVGQAVAERPHLAGVGHVRQVDIDRCGPGVFDRRGRSPGALGIATDDVNSRAQAG
jgi:hypothetical protein